MAIEKFAFQCDVLAGLDGCSAGASYLLGWDETFVVFTCVCMPGSALYKSAEHFAVR